MGLAWLRLAQVQVQVQVQVQLHVVARFGAGA
jgi:hypothetical protein